MPRPKKSKILVQDSEIHVVENKLGDFICLTDMVKAFDGGSALIENWMRSKDTLLFLGAWELENNPDFKPLEFEGFKNQAGRNSFYLSPKKWADFTGAIGIYSQSGRYGGGTYAHSDIAFEFGSWLSPEFKLFLIKEYRRLAERKSQDWDLNRALASINYRVQTDAIKEHLIPPTLSSAQQGMKYAEEVDVINVALYGMTAKQWRQQNPGLTGNVRDHSTTAHLIVLSTLESFNAQFIEEGIAQAERLVKLREIALRRLKSFEGQSLNRIENLTNEEKDNS